MKVKLETMVEYCELFYNSKAILVNKLTADKPVADKKNNTHFDLTPRSSNTTLGTTTTVHNELFNTSDTPMFKFYKNVDCPCYGSVQRDTITVTLNSKGFTIIKDDLNLERGEPALTHTDTIIVKNGTIDQATRAYDDYRGQITKNLTQDELESFFFKTLISIKESNPLVYIAIEDYKAACAKEVHGLFASVKTDHIPSTNTEIENIMLSYLN